MAVRVDSVALPAPAPGTERMIKVRRWGALGSRPQVHLQAASRWRAAAPDSYWKTDGI